jgi:hypothetical protein
VTAQTGLQLGTSNKCP